MNIDDPVGLFVSVPRDLRRRLKVAAYERDVTMHAFVVAALELIAASPELLSALEA